MIASLKKDPLFRALRCDKLVIAALQATVDLYLAERQDDLPIHQMLSARLEGLVERGERIVGELQGLDLKVEVRPAHARTGGGTLPRSRIESVVLEVSLATISPQQLAAFMRGCIPPVVGYVSHGNYRIDLRTVFPRQDTFLVAALKAAVHQLLK
jgi:L-seryl-tRNA(Ser) seleniumtransferase